MGWTWSVHKIKVGGSITPLIERSTMTTVQNHLLTVKGMSCQHCVKAITKALQAQDPQATVTVDLPAGTVAVVSVLDRNSVAQAISDEGYEVRS